MVLYSLHTVLLQNNKNLRNEKDKKMTCPKCTSSMILKFTHWANVRFINADPHNANNNAMLEEIEVWFCPRCKQHYYKKTASSGMIELT